MIVCGVISCTFFCIFIFFNATATTEIYTLSLHDALPIWMVFTHMSFSHPTEKEIDRYVELRMERQRQTFSRMDPVKLSVRSEEHTSELQSHVNLVCRLLLEKKKKKQ